MADLQFRGSWKQQTLPVRSQSAETLVAVVDRGPELGESFLILLDLLASFQTIDQGILQWERHCFTGVLLLPPRLVHVDGGGSSPAHVPWSYSPSM